MGRKYGHNPVMLQRKVYLFTLATLPPLGILKFLDSESERFNLDFLFVVFSASFPTGVSLQVEEMERGEGVLRS